MGDNNNQKNVSEFRRDIVSGDWIVVSSKRKSRPRFPGKGKKECVFDDPQKSGNPFPLLWHPRPAKGKRKKGEDFKNWFVQVIPNKYPILLGGGECARFDLEGIHHRVGAIGSHEVVIFRDHNKPIEKMSLREISLALKTYRERYQELGKDKCIDYILIFHNKGELAGASVNHPHSQIVALPITPPDISRSINGSFDFFKKYGKCAHCEIIKREIEEKRRIVFKNKYFVAINPYASRVPYEIRIFPISHDSNFEDVPEAKISYLAEALKDALGKLENLLDAPDYNFFIHTSSVSMKDVPYYHWHIEILPRVYKWAGLELGTGIEVVTVPPEEAAEQLRKIKKEKNKI